MTTRLDTWKLRSTATVVELVKGEDGRFGLILDRTVFHPQGGGQPADTGFVGVAGSEEVKFVVSDVRLKDGVSSEWESEFEKGREVVLQVDEARRRINSRIHSAGHLIDVCMKNLGLGELKPGKGYHFPQGPYVEYVGIVPQEDLKSKQKELELEANALISKGGKVLVAIVSYEEACKLCGEDLPDYIAKDSTPRIVKLGNNPGCPCGGTHVSDISDIKSVSVSQIRTKKGLTKVFYNPPGLNPTVNDHSLLGPQGSLEHYRRTYMNLMNVKVMSN